MCHHPQAASKPYDIRNRCLEMIVEIRLRAPQEVFGKLKKVQKIENRKFAYLSA
jgi:hypothetical protein